MKLTIILCTVAVLQVTAKAVGQTITFSGKEVTMEKIFSVVKEQTGYGVFYDNALLGGSKPVTVSVKELPLQAFLAQVLAGQALDFSIKRKTIFIRRKPGTEFEPVVTSPSARDTLITVTGKVTASDGTPIPGATIIVKGTTDGTTADENGQFSLANVALNKTLLIRSMGYQHMEILAGKKSILVKLMVDLNQLEETVVKGYYNTTRRLNTGNVTTITSKEIELQPVSNPLAALQGRVPGMFITQTSGVPGGGYNVLIRGQNSIKNGIDPFYVVDGVPFTSQMLPNMGGTILQQSNQNFEAGSGNALSLINPADIESITVLKDADATAIYGSRGANGVVLITTKKGKSGKPKITLNASLGISQVASWLNFLDTPEYLKMRREAFNNDQIPYDQITDPDLTQWDTSRSVNWQNKLVGNTAHYTDLQASISGGSEHTQYLISTNYHKETTVFPGDFSDQKGSVHFNINNKSLNEKLKMTLSGGYIATYRKLPVSDFMNFINLPPNAPEPYNKDGSLNWANNTWPGNSNPYSLVTQTYKSNNNNLISNLSIVYNLAKGLDIKSNFGYSDIQTDEISVYPISSINSLSGPATGTSYFTTNSIESWIIEPQLTYELNFGSNRLDALVGTTFQQNNSKGLIDFATGYTSDALLENIQAAPMRSVYSLTNTLYKYSAGFARLNYSWKDRYIINVTARRDGSSRFGDANKFHNFGSIGTAWIFSDESFVKSHVKFISSGKLRFSFGTTGNDQIGDYRYYDLYNTSRYSYQGIVGLTPSRLYNPQLAWEETRKFEFGLELGLLDNKIMVNTSYYNNRSSNQLLNYPLPTITGFPHTPANFPATVQNTGLELMLNITPLNSSVVNWTTSVSLTIPRNKLISFANLEKTTYRAALKIGESVDILKAFRLNGINPTTGIYEFIDAKGESTYSPEYTIDDTQIINTNPRYYGGFNNSFSYKNIKIDVFLQFTKQLGSNHLFHGYLPPGLFGTNITREALNRWEKAGDKAAIQKFTQSYSSEATLAYSYAAQSDYAYTDASFIRIKNVSLSYELPLRHLNILKLQRCKVYLRGQNLLTLTKYKGIDPESQQSNILPPLRALVAGIELSL